MSQKKSGGCCGGEGKTNDDRASVIIESNSTDNRAKLDKGVKLVLLGEVFTGKTCIASRLVRNEIGPTDPTIGAAFLVKNMVLENGTNVKLEIWDTAGQERYRSLTPMYYRGASAAVIVYDITKKNTFETLKRWVSELQKQASPNLIMAFAGNKVDLPNREVQVDEVSKYISELGGDIIFFETSAQTGYNVTELFNEICRKIKELEPLGLTPAESCATFMSVTSGLNQTIT
ncbi:Rab GTPase [Heterostelium album PN500]|uniref:Rab GTPase n=1 Tax=Heterostelium pallidum (strain ATCC 26659 / Pp 5 / PN500) TaxID=670386 RepID=D3B840_HETP5|nr:Rab GTPase [Heterostelium album PN500]EFA82208.1 Rab GTPase [Heterostelium album PN500]|eukprot:XP_020434325.1 Rab GTPase [Heterostelium album PN500]